MRRRRGEGKLGNAFAGAFVAAFGVLLSPMVQKLSVTCQMYVDDTIHSECLAIVDILLCRVGYQHSPDGT